MASITIGVCLSFRARVPAREFESHMQGLVLLTGGSGFFGRHLTPALRRRGYEVVSPLRPKFDLLNRASVDRALADLRPDVVVHAAAYYGGLGICLAEPADIFYRNSLMSLHLLDAAARAGVKQFLSVGSACAYPSSAGSDLREDDFWSGPMAAAVEAFGFSKKLQQVGMRAYGGNFPMRGQFPILAGMYGEHDVFGEYRSHVTAALIKKFADAARKGVREVVCWGTGAPVRELIYVGDAAEAVVRLLDSGYAEPLNIGTGIGTTIKELAELIAGHTGFNGKIIWDTSKPDGVMRKVLDVCRMKHVLNWQPPTSLTEGLAKTVRWYLANKDTADARP
jgi:nucleoside-diphosphate-sugar epimerase